ncbi:MAG: hypothetical protein MPN21_03970 [Thermoanaerobaculia bacterium]|nr:hypothetical protein [Thermoanaerobaculia bacterium]
MTHRRVRPRPEVGPGAGASLVVSALLEGVRHHLRADDVFHRHPVFVNGERMLVRRFRDAAIRAEKMGLFAHIGWELCLDGALLRQVGVDRTLRKIRQAIDASGAELRVAAEEHASPLPAGFHQRLDGILEQVSSSDWVPGYANGPGVAGRLDGVRRRVGLPAMTVEDLERLGRIFDSTLADATPALGQLLDDWSLSVDL